MKFPTTDIQSILEPVSFQVQTFIELHSFGEKGHSIPDISDACEDVRNHIHNLIRVGNQQSSLAPTDEFLKREMPKALEPLELSSHLLKHSANLIKLDGKSSEGRSKLIDACRNILFGTYKVLIVNDEIIVRKLETNIKMLMDAFYCIEAARSVQEVVEFLKSVYSSFFKVLEDVHDRAKVLTNKECAVALNFHADLLSKLLEPFVNSAKLVFLTQEESSAVSSVYSERCRMFFIKRILDEFALILKFLRLSCAMNSSFELEGVSVGLELQPGDENCGVNQNGAIVRNHLYNIKQSLLPRTRDWIHNDHETDQNLGFLFVDNLLSEAKALSDVIEQVTGDRETADRIRSKCDILDETAQQLSTLRKNGQGSSPQARQLQQVLLQSLDQLIELCDDACLQHVTSSEGLMHPLPCTMSGLLDEVKTWLENPDLNYARGSQCLDAMIKLGWNYARHLGGDQQSLLKSKCSALIQPMDCLVKLAQKQQASTEEGFQCVAKLHSGIADLIQQMRGDLANEVVDTFVDPHLAINRLVQAAKANANGRANNEVEFDMKLDEFQRFAKHAVSTGTQFSQLNESEDEETLRAIARSSKQLDDLIPILCAAAQLVYSSAAGGDIGLSSSASTSESGSDSLKQLNDLQNLWVDTMNQLVSQIDTTIDLELFLESSEIKIQEFIKFCLISLQKKDPRMFVENSTRVINCLNRVRQVCEVQSRTLDDEDVVRKLMELCANLKSQVDPFVTLATSFAKNPSNAQTTVQFHETSHEILDLIRAMIDLMKAYYAPRAIPVERGDDRYYTSSLHYFITPLIDQSDVAASSAAAAQFSANQINSAANGEDESPPPSRPPPPDPQVYSRAQQPSPVEEEEEEEEVVEAPAPEEHRPIQKAAHDLHVEVSQWQSKGNDIVAAAKRMALFMAKMSRIVRGEEGSKFELIETAKLIAESAMVVYRLANEVAKQCQEKKISKNLQNYAHKIPTLATQLNILSTVKATTIGSSHSVNGSSLNAEDGKLVASKLDSMACSLAVQPDSSRDELGQMVLADLSQLDQATRDDIEATEMLVLNAQNLMTSVKETIRASEAASIRIRLDQGHVLRWVRKRPNHASVKYSTSFKRQQQSRLAAAKARANNQSKPA